MPKVFGAIEATLSPARLTPFVREAAGDKHMALRLYVWNARLCEEFYIPIQITEVAARNAIGTALVDTYGAQWFNDSRLNNILPDRHKNELASVVIKKSAVRGLSFSGNDVIAGMTFGFWVHLMQNNYSFMMNRRGLRTYFSGLPVGKARTNIYDSMKQMRDFRNDIFHHEPIFMKGPKKEYANIRDLLSWICPETLWLMGQLCNPDLIIQQRPTI